MRILIYIPGDFNDGWDSNVRGEGRWSLNFGHMMAKHDHEVVFFGSPGRGEVPGCTVVPQTDPLVWEPYDVYHDTTFWPTRAEEIDAKIYIHAYWSYDDISAKIRKDYGPAHFGAIATYQRYQEIPDEAKSFIKLMPFPVFEEFRWGQNNFTAPELYLNWKFAFEDVWTLKRSIVSHALMHTALDLAEEFDLTLNVLHSEHVLGGHPGVKAHLKPDLSTRLRNHPKVRFTPECAWKDTLEILERSRLVLMNFDPPVSPLPVEAIALGVVPMLSATNIFEYAGPWLFEHLADEGYYRGPAKEKLRELCSNQGAYESLLQELRLLGGGYTYPKAYPICLQALEEMLAEV